MRAWLLCLVWGAGLLPAVAEPAKAEDIGALYQAYAIVTGTDMRQRPWGMAQCLREVLVKVSGDPLLKDDPRTAELAAHADRLVASFDYVDMMAGIPKKDDQGSYDRPHRLTVHFDPAKIDATLAALGRQPWRGERPVIVPVLLVQGRKPPAYVSPSRASRFRRQHRQAKGWGKPSSPVRSNGARRHRAGSARGGSAGAGPITPGASAASTTMPPSGISSVASCCSPPGAGRPIEPACGEAPIAVVSSGASGSACIHSSTLAEGCGRITSKSTFVPGTITENRVARGLNRAAAVRARCRQAARLAGEFDRQDCPLASVPRTRCCARSPAPRLPSIGSAEPRLARPASSGSGAPRSASWRPGDRRSPCRAHRAPRRGCGLQATTAPP
jgi:hypothetical protein